MDNFIGQAVGFLAVLVGFYIYLSNSRTRILILKLTTDFLWIAHFFMIGGYTAMLTTSIAVFREILFIKKDNYKILNHKVTPILFCIAFIVAAGVTWKGPQSLFSATASCLATIGFYNSKVSNIRIYSFLSSVLMLLNGIAYSSVANIINEIITMFSIVAGAVRNKKSKKR